MGIGVGTIIVIAIIALAVMFLRRRDPPAEMRMRR